MPKISALPAAASVGSADLFAIVQSGTTKKATASLVLTYVQANIAIAESQVTGLTTDLAARLIKTNNLSDVTSTSTALANLGGLPLAGGTMSGAINMGGFVIDNAANPSANQDLATKFYVDQTSLNGTNVYAASAATLGTVTQSGAGVGATLTNAGAQVTFALDGVNPPVGSVVLIKNTATGMTAANEGIYLVSNAGSGSTNWILTRATSYDTPIEINNTGLIAVQNGTTLTGTAWLNLVNILTVDTTSFNFSKFGGSTSINVVATQVFSAGTSTYTPTVGMQYCTVQIVAGGGSGGGITGGTAGQSAAGSGGGGGGYAQRTYSAALIGATATVVVGAGGAGAAAGANNGHAGGGSSFTCSGAGTTLTLGGGGLGIAMSKSAAAQFNNGGAGGTATGGQLNITGAPGGGGSTQAAAALAFPGTGGGSALSPGTLVQALTVAGNASNANPVGYGGGSSGSADTGSMNAGSSAGNDGICIVIEYVAS